MSLITSGGKGDDSTCKIIKFRGNSYILNVVLENSYDRILENLFVIMS